MEFLRKNRITITIAGVVLLVLVRMLCLLLGIDPINGYTRSVLWTAVSLAVWLIAAALLVVPAIIQEPREVAVGDSILFRIMSGLAAGVFLVETIVSLVQLWQNLSGAMLMYQFMIPWSAIMKVVFGVLSVGFFFLLCRFGAQLPSVSCLILILGPIGLYILRLIDMFMNITLNPSVDTYSLLVLSGGLALFFLSKLGRMLLDQMITRIFRVCASLAALALALSSVASLLFSLMRAPVYAGLIDWSALLSDVAILFVAISTEKLGGEWVSKLPRRHVMVGSAVPMRRRGRYIPKH